MTKQQFESVKLRLTEKYATMLKADLDALEKAMAICEELGEAPPVKYAVKISPKDYAKAVKATDKTHPTHKKPAGAAPCLVNGTATTTIRDVRGDSVRGRILKALPSLPKQFTSRDLVGRVPGVTMDNVGKAIQDIRRIDRSIVVAKQGGAGVGPNVYQKV